MRFPRLKAKIVEVLGEIWEQDVVLELSNGQKIRVFDVDSACNNEMIGKSKAFEIYVFFPAVIKTQKRENKVVCRNTKPEITSYDFIGEVIDIVEEKGEQKALIVDIGVGTIEVGLDRAEYEYEKFNVGDYVEVTGGRVDLDEIVQEDETK